MNCFYIIGSTSSFYCLSTDTAYKISFAKHFITQQLQICLFIIINGNKYNAFVG